MGAAAHRVMHSGEEPLTLPFIAWLPATAEPRPSAELQEGCKQTFKLSRFWRFSICIARPSIFIYPHPLGSSTHRLPFAVARGEQQVAELGLAGGGGWRLPGVGPWAKRGAAQAAEGGRSRHWKIQSRAWGQLPSTALP